jgi:hypothetical protein
MYEPAASLKLRDLGSLLVSEEECASEGSRRQRLRYWTNIGLVPEVRSPQIGRTEPSDQHFHLAMDVTILVNVQEFFRSELLDKPRRGKNFPFHQ